MIKYRVRKKGRSYSVEKIVDGKIETKSLDPVKTWVALETVYGDEEVSEKIKKNVSKIKRKIKKKTRRGSYNQHSTNTKNPYDYTDKNFDEQWSEQSLIRPTKDFKDSEPSDDEIEDSLKEVLGG